MRKLILISVYLLSVSPFAHAALFDDKEARQQIVDLQQKTEAQNQATQTALDALKKSQQALEQRILSIENVIKSQGLMDLLSQIDRLNEELNKVKGELEVAQHHIDVAQQRQKDLYADTDGRLRKLEAGNSPATNTATEIKEPQAQINSTNTTPAESSPESKAFEGAQALLQAGKYKEAFDAFDKFLQGYANSKQVPNAQYGLGYAQFSLKNYKAAIATQQKLIAQFPDSAKVPDAKFNIANCQIQLSDIEGAKKSLRELIAQHPSSDLIPNAKRRLAVLESIKK
ncbi:tol-pal system protein YbgF [Candidatus Methylopumilus turicensis]|uniref:Cell division coordinator CpoB n=1 Tax=Candidatus Methylopumilus turicensis TaxID=1581680 RepID=A0A0B7IWJ1_9PROT|nr:tol-pal system protein YbgF [Candidatus Methylopumilus turicensis]CEN56632.1 Tol-pal system protein YbgF [Candidatus Methylopumilus turicensis]